jgi:hypothetical protein
MWVLTVLVDRDGSPAISGADRWIARYFSTRISLLLGGPSGGRGPRISVSFSSGRSRCSLSRVSSLVASRNRSDPGARVTSSTSCRRAWSESSLCRSSITSHSWSGSGARSVSSSRSTTARSPESGAAISGRTSSDPGIV